MQGLGLRWLVRAGSLLSSESVSLSLSLDVTCLLHPAQAAAVPGSQLRLVPDSYYPGLGQLEDIQVPAGRQLSWQLLTIGRQTTMGVCGREESASPQQNRKGDKRGREEGRQPNTANSKT